MCSRVSHLYWRVFCFIPIPIDTACTIRERIKMCFAVGNSQHLSTDSRTGSFFAFHILSVEPASVGFIPDIRRPQTWLGKATRRHWHLWRSPLSAHLHNRKSVWFRFSFFPKNVPRRTRRCCRSGENQLPISDESGANKPHVVAVERSGDATFITSRLEEYEWGDVQSIS